MLLAPDRFKGSLTAPEVARHLASGLRRARPAVPIVELPVADGGQGTVEAAVAAGWRRIEAEVRGPTGRPVTAALALAPDGRDAVVEMAEASGTHRLPAGRPRPLVTTSLGTGQLLAHALRLGARRIVLGAGGAACADGGAGLVQGLGGRLLDALGRDLPPGGAALRSLHRLDLRGLPDLSGVQVIIAGEPEGTLLGRNGAAQARRHGATREEIRMLDAGLRRWADLAEAAARTSVRDLPGSGAAGGVGFAALAFLDARIEQGVGLMLDLLGFAQKARGARLVVTGEGSLDAGSLRGKAPVGVARAAARAGAPVVAAVGRRGLTGEQARKARFQGVYALTDIEPDTDRCMRQAGPLLEQVTVAIADEWLPPRHAASPRRASPVGPR